MMAIVKYLRREKTILTTKMEVLQSESARLKSKLEFAQQELSESRSDTFVLLILIDLYTILKSRKTNIIFLIRILWCAPIGCLYFFSVM